MKMLNPSDVIHCPHCDEVQDGVAEDFVIPGKPGISCEEECYDCGLHFTVTQIGDQFKLEKV